jgi:hypothetical protein
LRIGRRQILITLFALLALSACGGKGTGDQTTTPPPTTTPSPSGTGEIPNLAGSWYGTYSTPQGVEVGTFQIQFTQDGNQISGTIDIEGSPCVTHGEISGALSGDTIAFGAVQAEQAISFNGTVDGSAHMEGEYSAPSCEGGGSGIWEADRPAP